MGANVGTTMNTNIFVNYQDDGSGDYHLVSGSPAISAGTLTSATVCAASPGISPCVPTTDFSGKTRTTRIDIGAYEF